jgi:SAM-dependent methyltransferase
MANEQQLALWNGPGAAGLLGVRAELEAATRPLGLAAIDALHPAAGERALDVGCGAGDTALELARRVGPRGAVLGVDVAQPFLAVAREESRGVGNVTYLLADAQTHPFAAEFDVCLSRLGVMFFDDPPAAFRNLRRALRPGGRFAAVVWGPPAACAWVELPLRAVRLCLAGAPDPATAGPGPFSLCDRAALARLLAGAGFGDVRVEPLDVPFHGGASAAEAASFLLRFGPAAGALREAGPAGEAARPAVEAALREALEPWAGPRGVALASSALLATASAPGTPRPR